MTRLSEPGSAKVIPPAEPDADYDLVIIGAGLTGLSLCCWLLEIAEEQGMALPRVCLLEPRTAYENDRTWCFWDLEPHPFRNLIAHRWFRWQVSHLGQAAYQSSDQTPYAMLPSDALYHHALVRIENSPTFDLHQGITVSRVEESDDGVLVSANPGCWRTKAVVDTRPPSGHRLEQGVGCWQVFAGLEIHCPDHGFDTSTAVLMDFQPGYPYPCFVYLLPLDEGRLLVEWTAFQPDRESIPDYRSDLESWLAVKGLMDYEIIRSESGILPMMPVSANQDAGHVIHAGVGAGWMRAATGYHFASCQRGSEELARRILEAHINNDWRLQSPTIRPGWLGWMDRVFLGAVGKHPDQAPGWFRQLFANTSAEQMARFMNDQPLLSDAWAIARALPAGPFLREAMPL